jgi:hypothetical protein
MPLEQPWHTPPAEWPRLVQDSLLQIPSVTDVHVRGDADYLGKEPLPSAPDEDDNHRPFFWPEPSSFFTSFELNVPARMQPELLGEARDVGAETFRVRTLYGWHGPCTFVSCLDGGTDAQPDQAVRLVHAFLTRELDRSGSPIRIARLGPSPFHMRASILADEGLERDLGFRLVRIAGYKVYEFTYQPDSFADIDDAEFAVHSSIAEELQLFYELTRRSNQRSAEADRLSKEAKDLAALHTAEGLRTWIRRVFRSGSRARRLALEAMEARLVENRDAEYARRYTKSAIEQTRSLNAFTDFLAEASSDDNSDELETAAEVARLVEGSRSAEYEVVMIVGATLIGGLVGGLAGAGLAAAG